MANEQMSVNPGGFKAACRAEPVATPPQFPRNAVAWSPSMFGVSGALCDRRPRALADV